MLASSPWPKLLVTDAKNTFFQGSVMVTVAEIPACATSYSRDFQPLVDALRNVSLQMTRHAVALDSLLTFPVCQEEEMSVLADDVSHSHKLLSRISVDQIENFCWSLNVKKI
nr:hypothetical protein BaRGS_034366 [Batillaria attramentaria]